MHLHGHGQYDSIDLAEQIGLPKEMPCIKSNFLGSNVGQNLTDCIGSRS